MRLRPGLLCGMLLAASSWTSRGDEPPSGEGAAPELTAADRRALDALATSLSDAFARREWRDVTSVLPTELEWERALRARNLAETIHFRLRRRWRESLQGARESLAPGATVRLTRCAYDEPPVLLDAVARGLKEPLLAVEHLVLVGEVTGGMEIRIRAGTAVKFPGGWRVGFLD